MSQEKKPRQVLIYADETGKEPFKDWLYGLRDVAGRQRILARLSRLAQGNWGDCAPVGDGVSELRLFFGPGYRVYFGEQGVRLSFSYVAATNRVRAGTLSRRKSIGRST